MIHELRLQRALKEIHVRFARDSEGIVIAQMVHSSHIGVPNVAWEKIYPHWLIAEHKGETVGCIQLCYSAPIARLEFLSFIPGLAFKVRALSVKSLLNLASMTLQNTGAQVVCGCLGFDQKSFRDILKNEGCTVMMSGQVVGKKL